LKDDCLAQLQHDVGLFKDLGVNTIYVCRSGIDWLGGLTLVYADSRRCDRPHQGPHACDEDIGRCGSSCPFCEFASIPGAKAAPRPADVVIRLTIPQTLVSIHHCIRRTDFLASCTPEPLDFFFRTIYLMAGFAISLGCLITDHLIDDSRSEGCAPVITAIVRDLKKYMDLRHRAAGQRILSVELRGGKYKDNLKVVDYLTSGNESSRIDFWTVCISSFRVCVVLKSK
jgi:hypothetical protein